MSTKCPFPLGDPGLHPSLIPKHLDRSSRFSGLTVEPALCLVLYMFVLHVTVLLPVGVIKDDDDDDDDRQTDTHRKTNHGTSQRLQQ